MKTLKKIAKVLEKDKGVLKEAEEFRRIHGTLTQDDLNKTFTI